MCDDASWLYVEDHPYVPELNWLLTLWGGYKIAPRFQGEVGALFWCAGHRARPEESGSGVCAPVWADFFAQGSRAPRPRWEPLSGYRETLDPAGQMHLFRYRACGMSG